MLVQEYMAVSLETGAIWIRELVAQTYHLESNNILK